jgi:hypothetical protein
MRQLVERLEHSLAAEPRPMTVIYYNPVHGACFDASPRFGRMFAENLPVDRDDPDFDPASFETVVVWRSGIRDLTNRPLVQLSAWKAELV